LLDLPTELLSQVVGHLDYPDSLSLKLTCRYFNHTTEHTVRERVGWLIARIEVGLPIPQSQQCNMKTDVGFTASAEVRRILRDRRTHLEC
ncbi:uncharacterized protein HMPREF1541_07640, partial [Cyphellophora europaea CBS 101466]